MTKNCKPTLVACFLGYICQAIINNFAPLLFLTFQTSYGISLDKITMLVTVNFGVQLLTDWAASRYASRLGHRRCMVLAHCLCAAGLVLLTVLPELMSDRLAGLLVAIVIYAVGGGLLEVLVSPIMEACPTQNKAGVMSMLHSFYCWGTVATVLISTGFFAVFGIQNWKIMAVIWALVPAVNAVVFAKVPIYQQEEAADDRPNYRQLFGQRIFWLVLVLMVCAGACEQAVSQWASTFAEKGLGVSKTMGDLLGVCGFSVMMGLARCLYAKFSERAALKPVMIGSALLCAASYLMIGLSDSPVMGIAGCMVCGFSVGVFWPGTFSLATRSVKAGGTTMFALLALAGDVGCSGGPTYVGLLSSAMNDNLRMGILCALIFPAVLILSIGLLRNR